jgi:hypothetical protein
LNLYSGFGLILASDFELPELPRGEGTPDVVIRRDCVPVVRRVASPDDELRVFRFAGAFRIRNGREIVVDPLPEATPVAIRLVLLGTVMAFLLRQRGWLPLHGSAVAIDGRAALFLGPCGAGKSTTAAAFHARGHSVLSDDLCAARIIEGQCRVQAAVPRIRLLPSSRSLLENLGVSGAFEVDKHSYYVSVPAQSGTLPVERVYLLEFGEELRVDPVAALESVALLSTNTFSIRRRMSREALEIHVSDCASVAGTTRVSRLTRPQSMTALPDLVLTVEHDMK